MSSYAQYLMPLIALQAIAFASLSAAFRSATDSVLGINRRFKSMPIAPLTPPASRMSASMYRCSIALAVSLVCGHVIGFRFYGGLAHTVGFCVLVLLIGAALSFLGDLIGAATENPEATAPLMLLPQLILGFLSVGVQPVERFPSWIQPFVRNQPASQEVYALRALAGDSMPDGRFGDLACDRPDTALGRGLHSGCTPASTFWLPLGGDDGYCIDGQDDRHTRSTSAMNARLLGAAASRELTSAARSADVGTYRAITSSVAPRSHDRARVGGYARCVAGDTEHRLREGYFAGYRAQRSLWQRPADRDGRGDVRVDGRRDQSDAANAATACCLDCG